MTDKFREQFQRNIRQEQQACLHSAKEPEKHKNGSGGNPPLAFSTISCIEKGYQSHCKDPGRLHSVIYAKEFKSEDKIRYGAKQYCEKDIVLNSPFLNRFPESVLYCHIRHEKQPQQ